MCGRWTPDRLRLPELVAILSENLILSGYETTAKATGNALYFLLTGRRLMAPFST